MLRVCLKTGEQSVNYCSDYWPIGSVEDCLGYVWIPFSRLINGCYAIFLVVLYVVIRHWGDDNSKTFSAMVWFGSYSLELYIVHVALRNLMRTSGLNLTNPLFYAVCIIASVPISIALSKAVKSLSKTSSVSK